MKIVVLSFDQLSLHWLGCYGNLWLPTPNFDLIATQSTIFDRCYVETVNPEVTSHAWWDGSFRSLTGKSPDKASLFDLLNDFPVEVNLLAEGAAEDHRVPFLSEHHWNQIGEGDEGALVALIDAGVETIRQSATAGDSLLWLKGIGESSFEIPAIAWIEQVAEEEGLEPTEEMLTEWLVIMSQPELFAQLEIDQQQDLLEIFGAARIREIDEQVGRVWREIQSRSDANDWKLIITSAEGAQGAPLSTPQMNVPLIIGSPAWKNGCRRRALVQSLDLPVTLLDWFATSETGENVLTQFQGAGGSLEPLIENPQASLRDFVCFSGAGGAVGLATVHYYLIARLDPSQKTLDEEERKLFVLPEDRANKVDVALHDLTVTEALSEQLTQFLHQMETGGGLRLSDFQNSEVAIL